MENLLLEIYIQQQIESALCFDFWLSNNPEDNEEIIPKQPCITDSVDYEDGYNESDLDYMYDPEY